jgi:O-antigen/teichoic acid export membrane protein
MMLFLIVLGEPFILNFFGEKWQGTIMPLKILSLSVMVHMMANSHSSLIRGLGKPKLEMHLQLFKAVFLYVPLISFGIYKFGIVGAAGAYLINKALEVIIAQYFLKKLVNVSFADLFDSLKYPLLATFIAFIISFGLYTLGVHYLICAAALGLSYGTVIWVLMKSELDPQIKEFRKSRKKKIAIG